jgi:hypothetical protein
VYCWEHFFALFSHDENDKSASLFCFKPWQGFGLNFSPTLLVERDMEWLAHSSSSASPRHDAPRVAGISWSRVYTFVIQEINRIATCTRQQMQPLLSRTLRHHLRLPHLVLWRAPAVKIVGFRKPASRKPVRVRGNHNFMERLCTTTRKMTLFDNEFPTTTSSWMLTASSVTSTWTITPA